MEVDVVHARERDLDSVLREHAGAIDDAVVGEDEVRELPVEEGPHQPDRPRDRGEHPDPRRRRAQPAVERGIQEDDHDEQHDPDADLAGEEPPMGLQVEDDRLALVHQPAGVRHARNRTTISRIGIQGRTSCSNHSDVPASSSSGARSLAIRKPRARSASGYRSTSSSCAGPWWATTRCASSWTRT